MKSREPVPVSGVCRCEFLPQPAECGIDMHYHTQRNLLSAISHCMSLSSLWGSQYDSYWCGAPQSCCCLLFCVGGCAIADLGCKAFVPHRAALPSFPILGPLSSPYCFILMLSYGSNSLSVDTGVFDWWLAYLQWYRLVWLHCLLVWRSVSIKLCFSILSLRSLTGPLSTEWVTETAQLARLHFCHFPPWIWRGFFFSPCSKATTVKPQGEWEGQVGVLAWRSS